MAAKKKRQWRVSVNFQHPSGSMRSVDHIIRTHTLKEVWEWVDGMVGGGHALHTRVKEIKGGVEKTVATAAGKVPGNKDVPKLPAPRQAASPRGRRHDERGSALGGCKEQGPVDGKKGTGPQAKKETSTEDPLSWYKHDAFAEAATGLNAKPI